MKKIIALLFLGLHIFTVNAQDTNIVLELFTSQGCSSCPSADKLLKQLSDSEGADNIMVLSYHVDYWNRLGWKDPFSKAEYTGYQREYGYKFGGRSVYTPQLVINGEKHIVGSDARSLQQSINDLKSNNLPVNIKLSETKQNGNSLTADYSIEGINYTKVNFVLLLKEQVTSVKRGENRNRTLVNSHIVVNKKVLANSSGKTGAISFDLPSGYKPSDLKIVAYAQTQNLAVTGASNI